MTLAGDGGIFVSYRRQESSHLAGRLYDRLADQFGEDQVFIDVDTIEPGVDFADEIFRAIAACKVLLAIIGPTWLTSTDERGRRRLDDPDDIVRLEVEAALARNVRVIPILMEAAIMPSRRDLPESLAGLARRNALPIRHESFRSDAGRLVTAIERVLAAPSIAEASAWSAGQTSGTEAHNGSGRKQSHADRATRLLADAERIATSPTDEYTKAVVLSHLVQALAATDPDRAERIATSLTSEQSKISALSHVARALAAKDPDRATRLFAEAERIANSVTDEVMRAVMLIPLVQALAATDPDRAEHIANSVTFDILKALALSHVVQALAATDPDRAERIATSLTSEQWKATGLSQVGRALTATDPDRATRLFADAERIANSFTDESTKAWTLSHLVEPLTATDPDHAERIANSLTDESKKAWALISVAQALAATDPDRAERIATSFTSEEWKAIALSHVAQVFATAP